GFDEFFGNLYHLNAEEEPENPDYPKNPEFRKRFGPRGVLHSWATDKNDPTVDPQFGPVGKQKIENTGRVTSSAGGAFLSSCLMVVQLTHGARLLPGNLLLHARPMCRLDQVQPRADCRLLSMLMH